MCEQLFDAKHASNPQADETRGFSEPPFAFLNRSTNERYIYLRQIIESWFKAYQLNEKKALRNNLRGNDHAQQISAFFELYLHSLLKVSEFNVMGVDINPNQPKMDFVTDSPSGMRVNIEATCSFVPGQPLSPKSPFALDNLLDEMFANIHPQCYTFDIEFEKINESQPISTRDFSIKLQQHIDTIDISDKATLLEPWPYRCNGWAILVTPVATSSVVKKHWRIIRFPAVGKFKRDHFVKVIRAKGKKYAQKDLDRFVIVINIHDSFVSREECMKLLFGRDVCDNTFLSGRLCNPFDRVQPIQWKNYPGVSAVLVFNRLDHFNFFRDDKIGTLFHNPYSSKRLNLSDWPFDQIIVDLESNTFRFIEGTPPAIVLGLDSSKLPV